MNKSLTCAISGHSLRPEEAISVRTLDKDLWQFVQQKHPQLQPEDHISPEQLVTLQGDFVARMLADESGELDDLEREIVDNISQNGIMSTDIEEDIDQQLTFGERVADKVASFGGSWTFIGLFFSFLLIWMFINAWYLHERGFDPYPFILLNLILSCLAAIQAPIIMMSQNRQGDKDRQRSEHDYKINLKAELEIKLLHKKIDHMLINQNRRLLELQRVQTDMLEQLNRRLEGGEKND